jgi:proline iminopeptidase
MKAKIRGTEIYFDVAGMQLSPVKDHFVEKPVLFMLHGGPGGDHLRFKQHSLELQDTAQLIFIDHRGCGRSKKTKII